jgi:hypothetical protein
VRQADVIVDTILRYAITEGYVQASANLLWD